MTFCIITGTRPQIIKIQPIIKELISRKKPFKIIHTGQHYDYEMSKAFFKELKISRPDYNLGISTGSASSQLADMIKKLEKIISKINPKIIIVPGDTRSALGGALSANRLGVPLAHIEAGARSNDFELEEEINRRIIDHCSHFLFAPTKNCEKNLKKESVLGSIFNVGDTMYDIFLKYKKFLKLHKVHDENYVLMTIHRRQNILAKTQLKKIIHLTKEISNNGYNIIFPIHPHTKKQIKNFGISISHIDWIEPVNYSEMISLLSKARLLLTDSGGLQKEAFWSNTPCFTIRKSTEWTETLAEKNNQLISVINNSTKKQILKTLNRKTNSRKKTSRNIFGDGKASKKIVSILLKQF